jgi:uncharacterized protein (DUF924 family)
MYEDILHFWFKEISPQAWWTADPEFDAQIRERFSDVHEQARAGELYTWRVSPKGRLAEIIVLDQFSRNLFRNTPEAFAQDPMALVLAQEAILADVHLGLTPVERSFLLIPLMHSESRAIHAWAEQLYRDYAPEENYEFELKHKVIVDRFGRYPHRNRILGRDSTEEELKFLMQPGSSF